jgi:adenylosuccinate lyase
MSELPFMATEEILMAGVQAGGDRQQLHEIIRRRSLEAAEQVKQHGRPNDLIERLKQEPAFARVSLSGVLEPGRYVGRAPQQVEHFVKTVADPIRDRYRSQLAQDASLKV